MKSTRWLQRSSKLSSWSIVIRGGWSGFTLSALALLNESAMPASVLLLCGLFAWTRYQSRHIALDSDEPFILELANDQKLPPIYPQRVQDRDLLMVELSGGSFLMGSPGSDKLAYDDEKPQHLETLEPFDMSETAVTRGLYRRILPDAVPAEWQAESDNLPANYISWFDALNFCNALSRQNGKKECYREKEYSWVWDKTADGSRLSTEAEWEYASRAGTETPWVWDKTADGYRLPTEAEWEYACRAGAETPWFWGESEAGTGQYARYRENSEGSVHTVASTEFPNEWGLYDMAGNVWEWCWDWYVEDYSEKRKESTDAWGRVVRGGSVSSEPRRFRSADRDLIVPDLRFNVLGFRCVRRSGRQP